MVWIHATCVRIPAAHYFLNSAFQSEISTRGDDSVVSGKAIRIRWPSGVMFYGANSGVMERAGNNVCERPTASPGELSPRYAIGSHSQSKKFPCRRSATPETPRRWTLADG